MPRHENDNNKQMQQGIDNQAPEGNFVEAEPLARYITDLLNEHAEHLEASSVKKLSVARNLAVNHLSTLQPQIYNKSILRLFGSNFERFILLHPILTSAAIVGALLFTFYAAQHFEFNNTLESSDAFLLASDLPPEAYADKGFDTWLISNRE